MMEQFQAIAQPIPSPRNQAHFAGSIGDLGRWSVAKATWQAVLRKASQPWGGHICFSFWETSSGLPERGPPPRPIPGQSQPDGNPSVGAPPTSVTPRSRARPPATDGPRRVAVLGPDAIPNSGAPAGIPNLAVTKGGCLCLGFRSAWGPVGRRGGTPVPPPPPPPSRRCHAAPAASRSPPRAPRAPPPPSPRAPRPPPPSRMQTPSSPCPPSPPPVHSTPVFVGDLCSPPVDFFSGLPAFCRCFLSGSFSRVFCFCFCFVFGLFLVWPRPSFIFCAFSALVSGIFICASGASQPNASETVSVLVCGVGGGPQGRTASPESGRGIQPMQSLHIPGSHSTGPNGFSWRQMLVPATHMGPPAPLQTAGTRRPPRPPPPGTSGPHGGARGFQPQRRWRRRRRGCRTA